MRWNQGSLFRRPSNESAARAAHALIRLWPAPLHPRACSSGSPLRSSFAGGSLSMPTASPGCCSRACLPLPAPGPPHPHRQPPPSHLAAHRRCCFSHDSMLSTWSPCRAFPVLAATKGVIGREVGVALGPPRPRALLLLLLHLARRGPGGCCPCQHRAGTPGMGEAVRIWHARRFCKSLHCPKRTHTRAHMHTRAHTTHTCTTYKCTRNWPDLKPPGWNPYAHVRTPMSTRTRCLGVSAAHGPQRRTYNTCMSTCAAAAPAHTSVRPPLL